MGYVNRDNPQESDHRKKRTSFYALSNQATGKNPEDPPEVSPPSSNPESASPPLDHHAQITDLVCRVNDQWNQDQDPDKTSFLNAIRTMTVIENDDGIVPKGLKLSHEQRAALIVAVSTVLNIDQRDVPGEFSHEDHLRELIAKRYSSNDDPVRAFRTDLIAGMEKQLQSQER
jgi:hypothetical protein